LGRRQIEKGYKFIIADANWILKKDKKKIKDKALLFSTYLLISDHVCEGFIEQNIFATKTPRHKV
jgi:hypothetical protein